MGKAAELREKAIKAFQAADALSVGDDGPKPEDREAFEAHMKEGQDAFDAYRKAAATEGQVISVREALGDLAGAIRGQGPIPFSAREIEVPSGKTWGQAFIESEAYAELVGGGALKSDRAAFKSQPVIVGATTDVINTGSGGGGAALVTPQFLPGVSELPQRPLTIRELFSQGTTQSDTVSYAQQSAFEPATGLAVAQTQDPAHVSIGVKKQSSIAFERKTSPVETIATWMAATRQQLADAGQIRALIDNQLRLMLQLEEEEQLLNGNGTSPNLSGIYDQAIQTLDLTAATSGGDPNLDGVRNAMRLVRVGLSRLVADAVVLNPTDSMEFDLLVDNEGRYRIGDPFGQAAGAGPRPIWGLRRVESEAVAEGSALVGAFRGGATVLERQGITILTADQHADFFIRNLIVVLAEERLGFPVFFPTAFVDVTLASWAEPS